MTDFLDHARHDIQASHPDLDLDAPGFALLMFPRGKCTSCDGECGHPEAVEVAIASHPDAFTDMAFVVERLVDVVGDLAMRVGQANYEMARARGEVN